MSIDRAGTRRVLVSASDARESRYRAPGAQRACFTNTWPLNCSQPTTYAVEYLEMNGYSGSVSHRETTPC